METSTVSERNKRVYRRYIELLNAQDFDSLPEVIAHDRYKEICVGFTPGWVNLTYANGVLEIAGGLGLLDERTRRVAGIGLVLLLVAVWPANGGDATRRAGRQEIRVVVGASVDAPAGAARAYRVGVARLSSSHLSVLRPAGRRSLAYNSRSGRRDGELYPYTDTRSGCA